MSTTEDEVLATTISILMPTLKPAELQCDRYYTQNNKTHLIYGGYEGIPENLLINSIVWLVLLILFSFLRKIAWDYGRLALVSRTEARSLLPDDSRYNVWTSLFYGDHNVNESRGSQESLDTQVHRQDKVQLIQMQEDKEIKDEGFCSWIPAFFRLKDDHILQKSGRDAVQYLSFQRYLLVYMATVTVFSIAVVLPVNFQGDLEGNTQAFGHTTISNINSNSPTLWVHSVLAVVFLIIAVIFMRHFSVNLHYEEDEQATRTLMISNIPKDKCFRNILTQHFNEAYPEDVVVDVQLAYNISKLVRLDKKRQIAFEGMINSEQIYKLTGQRPTMVPFPGGRCCCCVPCCGCKEVDAVEYYSQEEASYRAKCEQEKVNAFRDTLGIAFVTFEDDHVASRVAADFRVSCKGAHNPHPSSVSRELGVHNWVVKYAPSPDNIYWENLSVSDAVWWMKAILINTILTLLLFFLTTPSIIMNLLNQANYKKAVEELHNPLLVQFVPTLILWAISALLPNLVYYSDQWIGHWTRTAEHHAVMRKSFIFLLLMILMLPSLGLTSAKALIEWFAMRNEDAYKFRWQCIFIPDNGAFFVNYVITSAFIGTAAELIRFPELFMYTLKLLFARSAAERTSVRKSVLWDFQFGIQYAWMLCVFAVVMAYSIVCPLITPFGLLYLIMKHIVDRYNIYFAYGPSKIDKNIHASAINFVIVAVIMLQFCIVFFTILRTEQVQGITIFSVVALFVTIMIFFGRICFGWFKGLSPITYKHFKENEREPSVEAPTDAKPFIPNVLLHDQKEDQPATNGGGQVNSIGQNYGSTDSPENVATPEQVQVHPAATDSFTP